MGFCEETDDILLYLATKISTCPSSFGQQAIGNSLNGSLLLPHTRKILILINLIFFRSAKFSSRGTDIFNPLTPTLILLISLLLYCFQ